MTLPGYFATRSSQEEADQPFNEQVRLIQQLDEEDRQTMFRLIDKMLTGKRFKDFFEQQLAQG